MNHSDFSHSFLTMMISNLPSVLIEEIFSRVTLRYLRAVRLTCKSWNTLSKSERFIKMYTSKAATTTREKEESMMIAMMNYDFYLMRIVDSSIEFKPKPSILREQVRRISQVIHCEGLLLCILIDDETRVLVWNPYCGQTSWIELRYSHRLNGLEKFSYSLGYENNESSRSFKLLKFIDYCYNVPEKQFFWYEIYDLDSGLWTTLDVTPHSHWGISYGDCGVFLKGNNYWCVTERKSEYHVIDHIICFDFTRERFGPLLPLPSSARDLEYDYVTLSCVREEKLAALFQHNESNMYEFEIWITTKIDVEMVSWSKFLKVDTEPYIAVTYLEGGFFIDEEKKVVMGFNLENLKTFSIIGEDGYLRNLDLRVPATPYGRKCVCSYVPSLVQIKTPARTRQKGKTNQFRKAICMRRQ